MSTDAPERPVTGADLELAMYAALKAHDMPAVVAILRHMACVDPHRAQTLYDLLCLALDLARAKAAHDSAQVAGGAA